MSEDFFFFFALIQDSYLYTSFNLVKNKNEQGKIVLNKNVWYLMVSGLKNT